LNRVEEACHEVLSEVLQREVKDPRVGFVTITDVKLTADLRHSRVFVSVLGDEDDVERSMAGLDSAKGYMRSALGKHLRIKYLPEIEFVLDSSGEEALRLEGIMKQVEEELDRGGQGEEAGR
jgi:ribosome-binding factor A